MPTYEYSCQKCDRVFEEFQSIKAEPLKVCPCSKKGKVKRLIGTGSGIIFKGTGFYETDYKRKASSASHSTPATKESGDKKVAPKSSDTHKASDSSSKKSSKH